MVRHAVTGDKRSCLTTGFRTNQLHLFALANYETEYFAFTHNNTQLQYVHSRTNRELILLQIMRTSAKLRREPTT